MNRDRPAIVLFLASFAGLFLELLMIRWLAAEVPVLGYFKNFPLLAAFVGLGAGVLMADRTSQLLSSLWSLVALSLVVVFTEQIGLDRLIFPEVNIDVWGRLFDGSDAAAALTLVRNLGAIFLLLAACTWSFVGIGQIIGQRFKQGAPLKMYTADILGSLVGVFAFALVSWSETGPHVWLAVAVVLLGATGWSGRHMRLRHIVPLIVLLAVGGVDYLFMNYSRASISWSPYYCIRVSEIRTAPRPDGELLIYVLDVNKDYHQVMVDVSQKRLNSLERNTGFWGKMMVLRTQYDFAYYFKRKPAAVLVGGAGTGNNVASALWNGANAITAVEIDPVIIKLGRELHPLRPYSSPRVRVVNDDIRSYLRKTDEKFDLIEYGILDSHTALSSLSSLRLDNYVYTVEGIRAAMRHLKPDGLMCLSFHESHRTWLGQRVFRNIELATGSPPVATKLNEACFFVFGPGLDRAEAANILGAHGLPDAVPLYAGSGIEPSTDNWPFLYSSPHGQPLVYYLSLVLLVALAAGLVFAIVRRDRTGATVKMDWHMFLLGAGFLLIETKALAELSLLFGSTWIVNVLVFAGIFVMVLLSVGIVHSGRWRRLDYAYICLGIVLLGWWFFPRDVLNTLSLGGRALVGTGLVVLPIFFAGIVFAGSFAKRSNASVAFGSNLIGAVVGGAVEATSLAWGIRTLTLLALGFYAASWAVMVLQSKRGESESPAV